MTDVQFEVEVGSEADVGTNVDVTCDKNPGHSGFIPFEEFTIDHLPNEWRHERVSEYIKYRGKAIVRLIVTRQDYQVWYGTGYVSKFEGQYVISTNNHVIRNQSEARRCLIEFNYDSDDRSRVIQCEGTGLLETSEVLDKTLISFLPIPRMIKDLNLVEESLFSPEVLALNTGGEEEKCQALTMPYKVNNSALLAIPYRFNINEKTDMWVPFHDGTVSKLASVFIKFSPVPVALQNQNLNQAFFEPVVSMENYMETTQGVIRTIAGETVLQLPQPLTKQEACQCQITFLDGSISQGTDVYFKTTCLTEANIKGLDMNVPQMLRTGVLNFQELLRVASQPFWFVHFKPIPSGIWNHLNLQEELSNLATTKSVVIIGHPHGWKKMVTIGRDLAFNLERGDGEYRCSVAYSGKTCPGSSGSPVLYLCSWRSYIHYGGKRTEEYQGQLVETGNVNKAWWWRKYLSNFLE